MTMQDLEQNAFEEELSISSSSLRRWNPASAAHRSWSRRSTLTSSSDTASDSFLDGGGRRQATCVARETAGNDCALHSFIVWAAVKRSASNHISLAEKRQCPLLRCHERFPDHEQMLQHLYSCAHLAAGEYWCHDCKRVEQLGDVRCRRCCLGPASKRKRIVSMAKTFFGSLGHHKSKSRGLNDMDLDIVHQVPPSYESAVAAVPGKAELQANEIFEMYAPGPVDPQETTASQAPKTRGLSQPDSLAVVSQFLAQLPAAPPPSPPPSFPPPPPAFALCQPSIDESLIHWEPSLTPSPAVSSGPSNPRPAKAPERPALQVDTRSLHHRHIRSPRRSKELTPSSSVRSTSSETSTASHEISPMSDWSEAWSWACGLESTRTSPADDLSDQADLFLQARYAGPWSASESQDIHMADLATENALADVAPQEPMSDFSPDDHLLHGDFDLLQLGFPFDGPATSTAQSADTSLNLTLSDETNLFLESTRVAGDTPHHEFTSASCLTQSVLKNLQVHVESSVDRLGNNDESPLARDFCQMSACSIVIAGLEAMSNILEGCPETSPVKLLCFVHVVYSFSLLVHGQDAFSRSTQLFTQALSYSAWLSCLDRQAYVMTVSLLWKPKSMADGEFDELRQTSSSHPRSESPSRKGKERADIPGGIERDPLILLAQHVLDELEYGALCHARRLQGQAQDLSMEYRRDGGLSARRGSLPSATTFDITAPLARQHGADPGFKAAMEDVLAELESGWAATPRYLELRLVQWGKMILPPSTCIDEYVLSVRKHTDPLYERQTPQAAEADPRRRFYRLDIQLLKRLIAIKLETGDEVFPDSLGADGPLDPLCDSERSSADVDNCSTAFDLMVAPDFDVPMDMTQVGAAISGAPIPEIAIHPPPPDEGDAAAGLEQSTQPGAWPSCTTTGASSAPPGAAAEPVSRNVGAVSCCDICGYQPRGDPRWFGGSMAKHKKLQHGAGPPTIYRCPFPGCNSQYRSRKDNLKQHQQDKGHFVDEEEGGAQRGGKRQRMG